MLLLKWNTVHLYSNKQVDLLFMRVRRCWSCTWTDGWGLGHPPGAASSAARPAGLVCWASGSKDASPGRIRQDHPSTQYSRDQKSGTLYEGERERERDVRCFYECAGVEMCLRGAGGRGQCSVPWRLSWVRGRRASFRATRRLWRPADVTSGLADRSNDASEGQTGRNLNRTTWATRPTLVSQ